MLRAATCMPRPCDWPVEGVAGWATANQSLPKKVDALAGQPRVVSARPLGRPTGTADSIALTARRRLHVGGGEGDLARLGHGEDLSNQLLPKKIEAWPPSTPASA